MHTVLLTNHKSGRLKSLAWALFTCALAFSWWARGAEPLRLLPPEKVDGVWRLQWTDLGEGWHYSVQRRSALQGRLWILPEASAPWPVASTFWREPAPTDRETDFFRVLGVAAADRGRLIEATALDSYSTFELSILFDLLEIPLVPQRAVTTYRLVYETIDPWGGRTQASGAMAVPEGSSGALPLVSYQHGTLTMTNEAPSVESLGDRLIGVAYASQGYLAVLPDYLGLGLSPGFHPYHHARSEASAGVDLLRAARVWCSDNAVALSGQVFLTGYSQGGHATMALHRDLERYHAAEFTVTAGAPMAGAYDLSGVTADDLLAGRPMPNPYYFAYLLGAYQDVYQLTNSLADLLIAPYDTTLPPLLNGNTSGNDINAAMPSVAIEVLRPEVLAGLRMDPFHPLREALRDNDLYAWTPQAPMRLYHCSGDRDVIFANSEVARQAFHDHGATQVELIDPLPGADHGDCAGPSMLLALDWFNTLLSPP